jgi:hypothetical protein
LIFEDEGKANEGQCEFCLKLTFTKSLINRLWRLLTDCLVLPEDLQELTIFTQDLLKRILVWDTGNRRGKWIAGGITGERWEIFL